MTNLFYSAQAGILAERLEEGKPCPVRGSTRHPIKAQKAQDVPSEEELKHLDFKAKELRNKANEQSNKCSGLIKTIGDEEERFTKLGWSTDEAELATLPIRIVKLENQINELSAKVSRFKLIPGLIEQLGTQRQHLEKEKAAIVAEQKKIAAEGEAEAMKIKADAEAEANRVIAQSLTGELLDKIKYEKWNGNVPQVQGSSTPIVSIG
jgi:regulator of protease activity HflC (stomatin/prohibitin superfamily)